MRDDDRDPARPDQIRRAAGAAEAVTVGLGDSLHWSQAAYDQFSAQPFTGNTADRFGTATSSQATYFAAAEHAHQQVTRGLRQLADPIEDEQRARQRRREAREAKQEAREELDEAKSDLAAAQSELTCAEGVLAAQRAKVAEAQAINAMRSAAGLDPVPVDTAGLHAAQQQLARARQQVQRAGQRLDRATDRFEQANERFDRARRAHDRADRHREEAVRAFVRRLQFAGVLPLLPLLPGSPLPGHLPGRGRTPVNLTQWLRRVVSGINKGTALAKAGPPLPKDLRRVVKALSRAGGPAQHTIDVSDVYARRRREGASAIESAGGTAGEKSTILGCARAGAEAGLRAPIPDPRAKAVATAGLTAGAAIGCTPVGRWAGDQTSNILRQGGKLIQRTVHDPVWPLRTIKNLLPL